ncbi:MAG: hypothetical protein GVY30_00165 [Chloroflexi bacterium]|nr:hypothetical protein [Chloroflexota bacterium]
MRGQIFELKGFRNDGLMLKHRTLRPLKPAPKSKSDLKKYPRCGECGRYFAATTHRDRCGQRHELSQASVRDRRRRDARQRMSD